jgi:hypothetical protein
MTQSEALDILKTGVHVFLTGEAGSGKTHVVNAYAAYLREHEVGFAVTASTGIAATHIRGMTIHSWSGIGIHSALTDDEVRRIAENRYVVKRIRKASVLIIDEISMLDGRILSLVERVCRKARRSGLPWGGLQVVLVGDFFQLPPVSVDGDAAQFAFQSSAWDALSPAVCYLTEQHRQEDDRFLEILSAIRGGTFSEEHRIRVESRMMTAEDLPEEDMTRLFSHNANVDSINGAELRKLPGKTYSFVMSSRGPDNLVEALKRGCLSPERLDLKEGATVMFTKNNPGEGYVNGTLGIVTGFESARKYPIVRTRDGERVTVEPAEWTIDEGDEVLAKISQLPLRLAWAMTIHKSQGVSLDSAVMDLSQTFEFGQGYVALSRVRRLSGIHLLGMNEKAFLVHPVITEQDRTFRNLSDELSEKFAETSVDELLKQWENFLVVTGGKRSEKKKKSGTKSRKRSGDDMKKSGKSPIEKLRERHPKAYAPWTDDDDRILAAMHEEGASTAELCDRFGRQPGSIRSRLRKLGLID